MKIISPALLALGCLMLCAAVASGSPILPFHIVSAAGCYLFFIACVVLNIGIQFGRQWHPMHAVASCEAGIALAAATMGTGAWWGYHAWGTPWVWDPRITGMFLMTLFFVSWRIAVAILGVDAINNRKLTATLIILGLPSMFFTHMAVRLFGGIHPQEVVPAHHVGMSWLHVALVGLGMACLAAGTVMARARRLKKASAYGGQRPE